MPYEVYRDENYPNIIHNIYSGDITVEDYYDVIDITYTMIRETNGTVHTILRYENDTSDSSNVMQAMRAASRAMPPNIGLRVVVTDTQRGKVAATFVKMGQRLGMALAKHVAFVQSLDEAYIAISEHTAE